MKKETSKKTEVITFRTSPEIKEKLEKEAELRDWKLGQLVERIVAAYASETKQTVQQSISLTINNNDTINITGGQK